MVRSSLFVSFFFFQNNSNTNYSLTLNVTFNTCMYINTVERLWIYKIDSEPTIVGRIAFALVRTYVLPLCPTPFLLENEFVSDFQR